VPSEGLLCEGDVTNFRPMRVAFKEWAIVVDALGTGRQIIVLRKGGIREGKGGFQLEHDAFFLFPTLFHQQRDCVIPAAQERFDALQLTASDTTRASIHYFAEVAEWRRIDDLKAAQGLKEQHIWREEVIAERFEWGKEKNIYALALRVFRLPDPISLSMRPEYGGCKSWIELERVLSMEGAAPVLDDATFGRCLTAFHSAIEGTAGLS
jgi:hypothetical protein